MNIASRTGIKLLILSICFFSTNGAFSQTAEESFLNDLIYLWNNHKYEKVYQPLKDFKASKSIRNDFEIDYMIATSACRSAYADAGELLDNLMKDYNLKKEDVDYVTRQRAECKKYMKGVFARVDAERISARGKRDDPTSVEVPKPAKAPKAPPADVTPAPDPTPTPDPVEPSKPTKEKTAASDDTPKAKDDIVRKPGVTQIVKGDKVITVKAGWSYYVRQDSIYAIPPSKTGTKVVTGAPLNNKK